MSKSRLALENEITELQRGKDMFKIKVLMRQHFKVDQYHKLNNDEIEKFLEILKDAIYKGVVR